MDCKVRGGSRQVTFWWSSGARHRTPGRRFLTRSHLGESRTPGGAWSTSSGGAATVEGDEPTSQVAALGFGEVAAAAASR